MRILANHALHPEEGTDPVAACHRLYTMQARRRVKHHVARRQLHALLAIVVLDDKFPAVVLLRWCEEQRRAEVGTNSLTCCSKLANRRVHVRAEGLAAGIA